MENAQELSNQQFPNENSNSGQDHFHIHTDPIIYNHIDEETGFRARYFSQKAVVEEIPFWSLLFEELLVVLLFALLMLTQ